MVDQRKGSSPTISVEEDHNDNKIDHHRSWKETTFIAGLTIVAAAYARRRCAPAWRSFKARVEAAVARAEAKAKAEAAGDYPGGFQNTMTTKEASLILGIGESSANDKVKEAHQRAIFKNHPDAGGSAYLASKINQAKDILMKNT